MLYNSRIGRRTKRISDSKLTPKLRDRRRVVDEDDDEDDAEAVLGDMKLTKDEVQGILELLPYKEALIKIAKGEFEIEKVEEAEEDEDTEGGEADADEENFEEDEDMSADTDEASEDEDTEEDFEEDEEDTDDTVEDSVSDAWKKYLSGNNK